LLFNQINNFNINFGSLYKNIVLHKQVKTKTYIICNHCQDLKIISTDGEFNELYTNVCIFLYWDKLKLNPVLLVINN